jgi:hypothetical protein
MADDAEPESKEVLRDRDFTEWVPAHRGFMRGEWCLVVMSHVVSDPLRRLPVHVAELSTGSRRRWLRVWTRWDASGDV